MCRDMDCVNFSAIGSIKKPLLAKVNYELILAFTDMNKFVKSVLCEYMNWYEQILKKPFLAKVKYEPILPYWFTL